MNAWEYKQSQGGYKYENNERIYSKFKVYNMKYNVILYTQKLIINTQDY